MYDIIHLCCSTHMYILFILHLYILDCTYLSNILYILFYSISYICHVIMDRRTGCMSSIINVIPSSLLFPANDFGPMNISLDQLSLPNSGVKRILFRVTTLFCWVAFCLMVLFLFVRGNFNGLDFPVNLAFSRPLVHLQTPSDQLSLLTSGEKRADGGWTIWFG